MALVWSVHALVVMLEWCFEIDLLDSPAAGSLGRSLREVQAALTEPWLMTVLPIAAVLAAYNGLVRRRIAETLGEALLMGAMMVGGMSVILDPSGTVGALGRWANQASLGTLAVTASGAPNNTGQALGNSMGTVFAAVIETPWCYLEFGDVGWCREPTRLDSALRIAGLKIASREQLLAACQSDPARAAVCASPDSVPASSLRHSARLLREARSNGSVFLALPANGPARNSINEDSSLLRTLCQSSDATACRGPTAAEAEFRTNSGTWPRVGGLLLIVAGVLGMLLLLGFIALRLLASALLALVYLLLAPAMVLAPAFGQAGRGAFRAWMTRLLGAVVSKLVYSFVLGVVLAVMTVLVGLQALGWWTQWLLMSAFWWGVFVHRHQALGLLAGATTPAGRAPVGSGARRVTNALSSRRMATGVARWTRARVSKPAADVHQRELGARAGRQRARVVADEQVRRTLQQEYAGARSQAAAAPEAQARLASLRGQLKRVRAQRELAGARGDSRGAAKLDTRGARLAGQISDEEQALSRAQRAVAAGERTHRRAGVTHTPEQHEQRARLLDAQAALPAAGRRGANGERRDYAALAGLAGHSRDEYERLDPVSGRAARLQIDRELAVRRELGSAAADLSDRHRSSAAGSRRQQSRITRQAGNEFDRVLDDRLRAKGGRPPAARAAHGARGNRGGRSDGAASDPARGESRVMDDAREVAARRKRQLGWNRR